MSSRIILVGDYNRTDFLYVAKVLFEKVDLFFIEFLSQRSLTNKECLQYGEVLYWKNYTSAYELLERVKPEKVVFYFIESFNHVALNVACKVRKIPTYHLEHGLRFSLPYYELQLKNPPIPAVKVSLFEKFKQFTSFYDRFRNRRFFERTKIGSGFSERQFLEDYFRVRSQHTIFETFLVVKNKLRLPDRYISFSPAIFNYHKELEDLAENYPVDYIGIPQFDYFVRWKSLRDVGPNILFIDQPLHEQHIYGWTADSKRSFLLQLGKLTHSLKLKLYIKPHPFNDIKLYDIFAKDGNVVIMSDQWELVVPDIKVVLGFSSTLLLPFIAMEHVSCFLFEMHPVKEDSPYSQFLLDSKACHAIFSLDDLNRKIENLECWFKSQSVAKAKFIEDYMYKFDGRSSERLRKILLDEVS